MVETMFIGRDLFAQIDWLNSPNINAFKHNGFSIELFCLLFSFLSAFSLSFTTKQTIDSSARLCLCFVSVEKFSQQFRIHEHSLHLAQSIFRAFVDRHLIAIL